MRLARHGRAVDGGIGDGGGVVDVVPGDRLARQISVPPQRKPGDSAISASRSVEQRIADQVVERAPEGAAAVEQAVGAGKLGRSIASCGARMSRDQRAPSPDRARWHRPAPGSARRRSRSTRPLLTSRSRRDRNLPCEPEAISSVLADPHRLRQRVVRVPGEDHVDALDARRELAVDVEAVVREQHHHLRAPGGARPQPTARTSSSRMPNDQSGIIQRGLAIGV